MLGQQSRTFKFETDERNLAIAEEYRVNEQIRAKKVRLITDDNDNRGIVSLAYALELAAERNLDLVEVAPGADPPVVRIMDYGKFMYQKQKRERVARSQQKQVEVKEIRLRPKTDDHHLSFKIRDARRWLEDGMKVKVRVRFRGREIQYPDIAREMLDKIWAELQDVAELEKPPSMEGSTMLMILSPLSESNKKK
ncbi:MAG: translation initiation factor IF-3 [Phototrophicales bacterium]|nr:MAG: translation initiation factor IF-3 [Phototrophicales bacterium]